MAKIHPYFVTFIIRSDAMPFKKCLIWTNFISFSVKHKSQDEFLMLQETLNQNYPERQNTVIFNYLLRKFCIFDSSSIFKSP